MAVHEPATATVAVKRHFTEPGEDPYASIKWKTVDVSIGDHAQKGVEAPESWGQNAINITSKLYFATVDGQRERSVRQLVHRVAAKITLEGVRNGYFEWPSSIITELEDRALPLDPSLLQPDDPARIFYDELSFLLLHQMAAFNTPVWLNVGVPGRKQVCSACFLLRCDDSMVEGEHSILEWITTESKIFKGGAGSGVNLSHLRGSMEKLSTGGVASGPTSYMRGADAMAGTLKSGGAHRRAAKMVILNADHPDIEDFVDAKPREDLRMRALAAAGFEIDPFTASGEKTIAESTSFQNANLSVGAQDEFMHRAANPDGYKGLDWPLMARTTENPVAATKASDLLRRIAEAAWKCGDPGMVFLDAANRWHTTPSLGPITTCNPCAETYLNDDSACNLASLNLVKFLADDGDLAIDDFLHAVDVMTTAMDITCSFSDLPTPKIEENTRALRQLGLGYANLGGALMAKGLPYDSEEGRSWAAGVTALMTGRCYGRSAELASKLGPYLYYQSNRDAHQKVIAQHQQALGAYPATNGPEYKLHAAAHEEWARAQRLGSTHGYRNAQATVIAPTGTISHMMGCDTTGGEPAYDLVTHKGLAGGGSMVIEVQAVRRALDVLGYSDISEEIVAHLREHRSMPHFSRVFGPNKRCLSRNHLDVFATANEISADGHVNMMIAVAPFISGSMSKTVNLPEEATVDQILEILVRAWRGGCKSISVYRNNSKAVQVLSNKPKSEVVVLEGAVPQQGGPKTPRLSADDVELLRTDPAVTSELGRSEIIVTPAQVDEALATQTPGYEAWEPIMRMWSERGQGAPERARMARERESITHKLDVGGHEGYITAGRYPDGTLGEIFLTGMGKEGTFVQGMMGAWSIAVSIGLQYGVPLEVFARKFIGMEFEPKGPTGMAEFPMATSFPDYVFRWLASRFMDADDCQAFGVLTAEVKERMAAELDAQERNPGEMVPAAPYQVAGAMAFIASEYGMGNGNMPYALSSRPCTCGGLMFPTGTCYTCSSCGNNTGCG